MERNLKKKKYHVPDHPIDSLYTVESVKDTVPVIEHIFGAKMQGSGKYFACFRVIRFVSVP